jgi:hypothetical protein
MWKAAYLPTGLNKQVFYGSIGADCKKLAIFKHIVIKIVIY